uniref:Uncharacterized protein n=1 Tax=Toxoplasma gondii (strain ATCC 50861 / VEG) TaxID=432359 RepID=A0A0F7V8R2_TOXGV|nr:TPA: hypothetical protein BN1205_098940 [Toxoplasma gondii VEG]
MSPRARCNLSELDDIPNFTQSRDSWSVHTVTELEERFVEVHRRKLCLDCLQTSCEGLHIQSSFPGTHCSREKSQRRNQCLFSGVDRSRYTSAKRQFPGSKYKAGNALCGFLSSGFCGRDFEHF